MPASAEPHSKERTLVAVAAAQDFNYKIALASGLRELQAGRLRQAEEQFGYLCSKFPSAPGGYRGLAKVRMEQADRPGALNTLRTGAAKLAKAGEHGGVVGLLNEALQLDPLDLAAHRRLAAAHALAGELDAAGKEYERYARLLAYSDPSAVRREVHYGLDSLGAIPGLVALASEVGIDTSTLPPPPVAAPARPAAQSLPVGGIPGVPRRPRKDKPASADPRLEMLETVEPSAPAPVPAEPSEPAPPQAWAPAPPAPPRERVPEPALDAAEDPLEADMRAAEYIAKGDPRAAQAALVAARHFIANGHTNAASDLLLQLIASGLADHQAQRLLVDVVSSIGKRDVARAKCALLAEALRLDGQDELALEVERLAQAV
jgi:tetratricopeptide (TPR) repeat protein